MNEKPAVVKQVIREISFPGETGVKSPDNRRPYCLLDLFKSDPTNLQLLGPMINLGTCNEPKWYVFKVAKEFKSKKEAEEYSKKNKIEIVSWAIVD